MASKKCFKSLLLISFRTMLFLLVDYIDIDDRKRFSFATSPHSHSSSDKSKSLFFDYNKIQNDKLNKIFGSHSIVNGSNSDVSSGSDLQNPARYYRVQESPERRLLGTQFYTELNKQFDTPEYYEWQKSSVIFSFFFILKVQHFGF